MSVAVAPDLSAEGLFLVEEWACAEAARAYARWGLKVFPLAPDAKVPIAGSRGFLDATDDPARLAAWWAATPSANLAIATGASDLVVVDVDPRKGGADTLAFLVQQHGGDFLQTPTALTGGGGQHLYYRRPAGLRLPSGVDRLGPGLDVRGDGGYAVAPPSTVATRRYHWEFGYGLDEHPLAALPAWMGDLLAVPPVDEPAPSPRVAFASPDAVPAGTLRGPALAAYATKQRFLEGVAPRLGLPTTALGRAFRCVLPGHDEDRPSAALYRNRAGNIVYVDFHAPDPALKVLALAEVYAAQRWGKVERLSGQQYALWTLRLLVEAGLVAPAPVPLPPLPPGARPAVVKVYNGLRLLFGCRWLHTPGAPAPFSWRFGAAWCGPGQRHVGEAMGALLKAGVIHRQAKVGGLSLFLPGPGKDGARSP